MMQAALEAGVAQLLPLLPPEMENNRLQGSDTKVVAATLLLCIAGEMMQAALKAGVAQLMTSVANRDMHPTPP
jgi:hypothetical protein